MPAKSPAQERLMQAAAHTPGGYGGVPQSVGKEFVRADNDTKYCAGILFRSGKNFLLVKRADNGMWESPGGHVQEGETREQAAVRECAEEIGVVPPGVRNATRHTGDYLCFVQDVEPFEPTLNYEHTDWAWMSLNELPSDTIPECKETIALLSGHEYDIAEAIMRGDLMSPQHYENVDLFDLRITGTGASYRDKHNEYTFRTPDDFLTDEFVKRCNGLPLIFEHPLKKDEEGNEVGTILDTDNFRNRSIGSIMLPYIKNDEVRGVAKVFDDDASYLMKTSHISTSPAVVFRDAGSTESLEVESNSVLIEGKPSYLDHIAICEHGVWDKGGEPNGILNSNDEEPEMDEKDKEVKDKKEEITPEEQVPAWASALTSRIDSVVTRLDSMDEEKEKEKEKVKADESESEKENDEEVKADADEPEKAKEEIAKAKEAGEKEKVAEEKAMEYADSAARAENKALKEQLEKLAAQFQSISQPLSHTDRDLLSQAQARADSVAQMLGERINGPLNGETPIMYRKRLADKLKAHSVDFKDVKLDSLDGETFKIVEDKIYADAQSAALEPSSATVGRLIRVDSKDSAGRTISTFTGDMNAWLNNFKSGGNIVKFNRNQGAN